MERFAPAVDKGRLRRPIKKLPAEHSHAVIEEGLADRRKGLLVKGMVGVHSSHSVPIAPVSRFDGDLGTHSFPPFSGSSP
jgi:hypothetical protein